MGKTKYVFVINGCGGVGKDEFVKCCKELVGDEYVLNYSTIDIFKYVAKLLGWNDGKKSESVRAFLSAIKQLSNKCFDTTMNNIDSLLYNLFDNNIIVFIHSREPKEIEQIINRCNSIKIKGYKIKAYSLLIRRPGIIASNFSNSSDSNVENFNYDEVIDNDGSREDLKSKAWDFLQKYMKGDFDEL